MGESVGVKAHGMFKVVADVAKYRLCITYWTCNWGGAFTYRETVRIDLPTDWDNH